MFNSARCCLMLAALCLMCPSPSWGGASAGAAQPASKAAPEDANAQYERGVHHAKGLGMPRDLGAARSCFEQSAAQGHAEAQFRLGQFYEQGLGGPQDYAAARRLEQELRSLKEQGEEA